jgi:hypothetical protein
VGSASRQTAASNRRSGNRECIDGPFGSSVRAASYKRFGDSCVTVVTQSAPTSFPAPFDGRATAFGDTVAFLSSVIPACELVKESASSTVSGFFAAVVILGKGNG